MPTTCRTFIVGNDLLVRFALTQILLQEEDILSVGSSAAQSGLAEVVKASSPDIIVVDAVDPQGEGLHSVRSLKPLGLPIIVLTNPNDEATRNLLAFLDAGATSFIQRPYGSDNISSMREQLLHEIRINAPGASHHTSTLHTRAHHSPHKVVAIGSSTGGPEALTELIPKLPADFPAAVVIVQHMPGRFTKQFAARLNKLSNLTVKEAEEGDMVEKGLVLLARGDYHLVFKPHEQQGTTYAEATLTLDPPQWKLRPTVDKMMSSLAPIYGSDLIGVILTGMGQDGVIGMYDIKKNGGQTVVQDKSSSVVYGMAQEVVKHNLADKILPLPAIVNQLINLVGAV